MWSGAEKGSVVNEVDDERECECGKVFPTYRRCECVIVIQLELRHTCISEWGSTDISPRSPSGGRSSPATRTQCSSSQSHDTIVTRMLTVR